jgi:hypothetical protein
VLAHWARNAFDMLASSHRGPVKTANEFTRCPGQVRVLIRRRDVSVVAIDLDRPLRSRHGDR